jgi:hypothetical protein
VAYTAREGTPTGCLEFDPEDEADATEVYVAELEPVGLDSDAWDRDAGAVYLDVELLSLGTHPFPYNLDADDTGEFPPAPLEAIADADRSIPAGAVLVPPELEALAAALPPISGGSPTPTEADRRDFEHWLAQADAGYPPADQAKPAAVPTDRHSPAALARINLALYGRSEPFHA